MLTAKLTLELPLYEEHEAERVKAAMRKTGKTGKELLEQALAEYLDELDEQDVIRTASEPAGWDLRHGEYEGDQQFFY